MSNRLKNDIEVFGDSNILQKLTSYIHKYITDYDIEKERFSLSCKIFVYL